MNYSHIIDDMIWSYSRITAFTDCPYRFYLTYIRKVDKVRHFFSDYGSFMHKIIEKYLTGELLKEELTDYYLTNFRKNVVGRAPSKKIFDNYFNQGLEYLQKIKEPTGDIIGVEQEIRFTLGDKEFIGYIDLTTNGSKDPDELEIDITDNKSRALKPRSGKDKPIKSDKELDEYLRQLYIYSIYIKEKYGVYPKRLRFNCFRTQTEIIEPFDKEVYEETKKWALNTIDAITDETEWKPNVEWFKCKYLCDVCNECEYYQMFNGNQ